jgi:hypothetical protein
MPLPEIVNYLMLSVVKNLTNVAKDAGLKVSGAMITGPSTGAEICVRGVRTRVLKISLLILLSRAPISL